MLQALGISVVRASGQKVHASQDGKVETAHVNLVQSVTIPVKGQLE